VTKIVLTRHEVTALADYAATQSSARTYALVRDTKNVLHVQNANGQLYRLSAAKAPE
jgi:hypothetical protein